MRRLKFILRLLLNRAFWGIVGPLRRLKRRFIPARNLRGVKCIVQCGDQVLLVRIAYAHRLWTLPGGGVGRKESWLAAALRETLEETGVNVTHARYIGEYKQSTPQASGITRIFYARLAHLAPPHADGIEIAEAAWFPLNMLPQNRVARLDEVLGLLLKSPHP